MPLVLLRLFRHEVVGCAYDFGFVLQIPEYLEVDEDFVIRS